MTLSCEQTIILEAEVEVLFWSKSAVDAQQAYFQTALQLTSCNVELVQITDTFFCSDICFSIFFFIGVIAGVNYCYYCCSICIPGALRVAVGATDKWPV